MNNLTLSERERITDSMLKIQSVRTSLDLVDEDKIPAKADIETCLESADINLRTALGYVPGEAKAKTDPLI
jgi:hypothetical protein